jgi:hypothetical protein
MFFSSPSLDLQLSLLLLGVSFFVSVVIYIFKRNLILSLIWFSILGNLSFLVNLGSRMYSFYKIEWFAYFVFIFWPLLNLFLIIFYAYGFFKKK